MDWTQINFTEVFNGLMIVGALFLAWLSRRIGIQSRLGHAHAEPMELAGAVIDKVQAETIVAALSANTEACQALAARLDHHSRDTVHAMEGLQRDIRDLTQETIRAARK